jgi:hypothetical protein
MFSEFGYASRFGILPKIYFVDGFIIRPVGMFHAACHVLRIHGKEQAENEYDR